MSTRTRWQLNCREATQLVLQGQDRRLATGERLRLRLHLLVCRACPRFARQMQMLRGAMGPWRAYRDDAEGGDPPPG